MNTENLWNTLAESVTLTGILKNPDHYWSINEVGLDAADFGGRQHKHVFAAIQTVAQDKQSPDLPAIVEALKAAGNGNSIEFVNRLYAEQASLAQAKENARLVKGLAVARQLEALGVKTIEAAREHRSEYELAFADVESEFAAVRRQLPSTASSPNIDDIIADIRHNEAQAGIPVRFSPSLQHITGGLIPGWLWVIGGFSSVGKSAVAVNFALDVLKDSNKWVGIVSTEMPKESYAIRILSAMSGIPQRAIRDRVALGSDQIARINDAERQLSGAHLRIFDSVYSLKGIRAAAVRLKKMEGLDVLIVDFLQNVYNTGDEVADARTAIIGLQEMAKELGITVICLSQISNAQAISMQERPDNDYYAFKGSGAIKDAADVAIMLSRNQQAESGFMNMNIVKNRHEQLGKIILKIDLPTGKITESNSEI